MFFSMQRTNPMNYWNCLFDLAENATGFNPRFNIQATDNQIDLVAEIPGLAVEDLNISMERNVLIISGQKKQKSMEGKIIHSERGTGSFRRSFQLPFSIEESKIEARLEAGVLYLTLPRLAQEQTKRIEIKVS